MLAVNLGYLVSTILANLRANPFHSRYQNNKLRANGYRRAARQDHLQAFRYNIQEVVDSDDASGDDELLEEGSDAGTHHTNGYIQAARHAEAGLPSVGQALAAGKKIVSLAGHERQQWDVLCGLPHMKGTGFNRKNFALLLRDTVASCGTLGDEYSPGGSGPRGSYNTQIGRSRKTAMKDGTLQALICRDLSISSHYWSKAYFSARYWALLSPNEREVSAVMVAANRCAQDKNMWKKVCAVSPPKDYASWREFVRSLRMASPP